MQSFPGRTKFVPSKKNRVTNHRSRTHNNWSSRMQMLQEAKDQECEESIRKLFAEFERLNRGIQNI